MICQSIRTLLGLIMCEVIFKSLKVAESGFHKTPSNTVAIVGQLVEMTCWTNPGVRVQWFFSHHGDRSFVYNGKAVSPKFTHRFSVNTFTVIGHHDLTAVNVTMTDAGIYECVVLSKDATGRSIPVSSTAELIILESDPVCNSNISTTDWGIRELEYAEFRCAVNFSGQYPPSMQWSEGERNLSETSNVENSKVSHGIEQATSVAILQVRVEMNGIMITCETQFIEPSRKFHYTNATNQPDYLFRWNTTLNVHFGARNVKITPLKDRYRLEDVLNCSADGNPSPSFIWRLVRTQEPIAVGPQLALNNTRIEADQRHTIECIAQNHVAGEGKLSSATVVVIIPGYMQFPFGYIIGASIGIGCTLVVGFIVWWIQKKVTSRKMKDKTDLTKGDPQNLSPDYDSIPEAELNESPSMPAIQETAVATEDISDNYSALAERPIILQLPVAYSSLEAKPIHVEALPGTVTREPPIYVNMAN